mmetsp:Transcript_1548/g.4393  ORF Transcript_1548/g.4393 Transcript_1548/m.4393 type:complete len:147 (+) Transcript_1548:69-509(+)
MSPLRARCAAKRRGASMMSSMQLRCRLAATCKSGTNPNRAASILRHLHAAGTEQGTREALIGRPRRESVREEARHARQLSATQVANAMSAVAQHAAIRAHIGKNGPAGVFMWSAGPTQARPCQLQYCLVSNFNGPDCPPMRTMEET